MPQVIFYTQAYNAEKTIARAIQSILSQTYPNWIWHLVENGSTDRTGEIIERYARLDDRIKPYCLEKNNVGVFWDIAPTLSQNYADNDFFAWLDADDEYKPDFLEKALAFMQSDNLDIVACGTQFIWEQTGEPMSNTYSIPHDLILSRRGFVKNFPVYLQFMYTIWGKLYSLSLLRKCDFSQVNRVTYGGDTIFAMEAFSHARRVGILGGTLHNYYISPKSISNVFDDKRIISDQICCDCGLEYLRRVNASLPENQDYIYSIYANAIKNTAGLITRAQMDPLKKLRGIREIFVHPHTREILRRQNISNQYRLSLQAGVQQYILSLPVARTQEGLTYLVDTFAAMQDIADPIHAKNWSDSELFALLIAVRIKQSDSKAVSVLDGQIEKTLSKSPLLTGVTVQSAIFLRDVVTAVLRNDLNVALKEILRLADKEIPDECAEAFILLGSNLSAAIENVGVYIYFKKVWVSYLLDCSREEEARQELDEFAQILPNDEDFAVLRKRLN